MPKPDAAHLQTDKELAKLEKRIAKIYKEAADDLQSTIDDYFAKFAKRDAKQKARLDAGEITEQEYKQWRLAQMGRGERFKALQIRVAERYTEANETAVRYVNDATPGIYSLNRNYSAYTIEKVAGNVGFDLWDEQTVKRLIVENPEVMPYYPPEKALKRGIDLAYGKKQISASVTSSILQGKSIPIIAKDLQTRMPEMNKSSAIRTARTAVTGAQNAGRMDSYVAAEKMGIKLKKCWLTTLDGRTRHSHAMLDGEVVDKDKKFENGCMFPGDPNGPPWEVYNCRCTLIAAVDGVETSNAQRRVRNPETGKNELVSDMTYSEWAGWKEKAKVQKAMAEKQVEERQTNAFTPAKTTAEAEAYAKEHIFSGAYLGKTSYKGIDVDMANGINETIERITQKYGRKLSGIEVVNPKTAKGLKALGGSADAPFATNSLNGMVYINKDIVKNAKALKAYTDKGDEAFKLVMANKDKLSGKMRTLAEIYEKAGKDLVDSSLEGMITHEYGHYLAVAINPKADVVSKIADGMGDHLISGYSQHNVREYLAECFTEYERGDRSKLDPIVIELFEGAIKR